MVRQGMTIVFTCQLEMVNLSNSCHSKHVTRHMSPFLGTQNSSYWIGQSNNISITTKTRILNLKLNLKLKYWFAKPETMWNEIQDLHFNIFVEVAPGETIPLKYILNLWQVVNEGQINKIEYIVEYDSMIEPNVGSKSYSSVLVQWSNIYWVILQTDII